MLNEKFQENLHLLSRCWLDSLSWLSSPEGGLTAGWFFTRDGLAGPSGPGPGDPGGWDSTILVFEYGGIKFTGDEYGCGCEQKNKKTGLVE